MVLPALKSSNLISIGQLCDDGCDITMDKNELVVSKNNSIIWKGHRNSRDDLWDIRIPKSHITTRCYPKPIIHPSLYPSTTKHHHQSPTSNAKAPTRSLPLHLQHLSELACDNNFHNILEEQDTKNK